MAGDVVLVTGATGFVGSAVARKLAGRGFQVQALVRESSPRTNLEGLDIEPVTGDMLDRASMDRALHGARFLFHVAADYRLWARDPQEIIRNNLKGTGEVMEAALAARVERVVYTSSVATLNPRSDGQPVDETSPATMQTAVGAYKKSKVAAERLVERLVAGDSLPAVIVNPSTPIGPRDIKPTPTGKVIVDAATGKMPAVVDTGLNLAHVDDIAQGHLDAFDRGRIGERYVLGGQDVSLMRMVGDICGLVGRPAPRISLPLAPLFPIAWVAEVVARDLGGEPFVTVDELRMASHKMFFSSAKAERELGYRARPYGEGLKDAIDWFRRAGYLT